MSPDRRPLIAHVVYRFAVGGLENGLANLINRLPAERYRHAIVALTDVSADFAARLERQDVLFHALHKPPGHAFHLYPALYRLFRQWRPAVVHTRNLAALEAMPAAWAAGVRGRVHGEHGRDVDDLDGSSVKQQWIRRLYRPFVGRYIALSQDLERYLVDTVGVPRRLTLQLYNGVDTVRFKPAPQGRARIDGAPEFDADCVVVGTVGRMQQVKHQTLLAEAFVRAVGLLGAEGGRLRLAMAGDGPLHAECSAILARAGLAQQAWLAGERNDIPEFLRSLDLFVLPSLAEGISNTILEAMACGLPVLATRVGGNAELIEEGVTGELVASNDVEALASRLAAAAHAPDRLKTMGAAGRKRVESRFSLEGMVENYARLYDELAGVPHAAARLEHA